MLWETPASLPVPAALPSNPHRTHQWFWMTAASDATVHVPVPGWAGAFEALGQPARHPEIPDPGKIFR